VTSEPTTALLATSQTQLAAGARAVAIGNFDGVHLGHQAVIRAIVGQGLRTTVITFDPHPRTVLGPETVPALTSMARRAELLGALGVHEVLAVPFTRQIAAVAAEDWARRTLTPLDARVVAVGEGFRFGNRRAGDVALLRRLGFDVHVEPIRLGASSSRIRTLVAEGRLPEAQALLGRPFELEARVLRSDHGAREAVLRIAAGCAVPPPGPYAARIDGSTVTIRLGDETPRLALADLRLAAGTPVTVRLDRALDAEEAGTAVPSGSAAPALRVY
jgi:riboflavin kinase/FMN adenylyltransferase